MVNNPLMRPAISWGKHGIGGVGSFFQLHPGSPATFFDRLVYEPPCVTLPETNMAPESGWLEDEFPFGSRPIFRGELLVFGSV